jgi:hypothetical protein
VIEQLHSKYETLSSILTNTKKKKSQPDMVVHAYNPSTLEAEAGRSKLEASLGYRAR